MPRAHLIVGVVALVSAGLVVGGGSAVAAAPKTLLVDDDRAQCAAARFTSIQAAVDAAGVVGDRVLCARGRTPSLF